MRAKFLCFALLVFWLCTICGCVMENPAPAETSAASVATTATELGQSTLTQAIAAPTEPEQTTSVQAIKKIAIDAGHQAKGNNELELIGPGAMESKPKVSSGTQGVSTGVPEYQLTLDVSKKLRDVLLARGHEVFMVRESNDVNISNRERAEFAAEAGADVLVRIHANGSENPEEKGLLMVVPTPDSPFVPHLYKSSRRLADAMLAETLKTTGAQSNGVWETDTMSGTNWSTMPVVLVEMGFMSNPEEDKRMQQADYQDKLATGMANGIDRFFNENQ